MSVSHRIYDIYIQKRKYWSKTLSQNALDDNIFGYADMFDKLYFFGDLFISDTVFSSLLSISLLGIQPYEIVPFSLNWRIELPSIDEFLSGLLIKLIREELMIQFPELFSQFLTLFAIFDPKYAETIHREKLEKGIIGKSKYARAYYDPTAQQMFLRSTMYSVTKRDYTDHKKIDEMKALAESLDLHDEVARYMFNCLQFTTYAREEACSFDYCWFDFTKLPEEDVEAKVPIIDYDSNEISLEYLSIADSGGGCWTDNCVLDLCFFMADEPTTIYLNERAGNLITEIQDTLVRNFARRITATPFALANYQRTDERIHPKLTGRVESYAAPRFSLENTRRIVLNIVSKFEQRPYIQNLYVDAAFNLIKLLSKEGGWGDEAQKSMNRNELLTYWTKLWTERGLSREVLEQIFKILYDKKYIHILRLRRRDEKAFVQVSRSGS